MPLFEFEKIQSLLQFGFLFWIKKKWIRTKEWHYFDLKKKLDCVSAYIQTYILLYVCKRKEKDDDQFDVR